ncbi:hypothetical protein IMAU30132_00909 [Lactobacillus helveticus]|nr:hypothetical protein [Lactobacillus helveticus]NRO73725.1 hypothetical protein [Lactobacillus helveticus]
MIFKLAAISEIVNPDAIEITPAKIYTKIVVELLPVWAVIVPILKNTPAPITEPTTVARACPKEICLFILSPSKVNM